MRVKSPVLALVLFAVAQLPAAGPAIAPLPRWTAHWIAAADPIDSKAPLPVFRKSFPIRNAPIAAVLYITGLGQYEAHLNGRAITLDRLTPGWTDYRKRILYNAYDVLPLLRPGGANTLGVLLGNGMYNIPETPGRYSKFTGSFGQPKLIAELHLAFADGTHQTIASDNTWTTHSGPITFSSTYGGEDFDARLLPTGWDTPSFNDATWSKATEATSPGGTLVLEDTPPIRVAETYSPVKITHPEPGIAVYDLGQNFAGWPTVRVTGPAGSTVRLLGGELLTPEGRVTQRSANAFPADPNLFTYTLAGIPGGESWTPRFSYYGFRYVEAQTSSSAVHIDRLQGEFVHAAAPVIGTFSYTGSSTGTLFNRIHTLIDRAILSNMVSVLTDCPHREKLGWLEQTHLAAASIMLNYDVSGLYRKMEDDMADSQLTEPTAYAGLVPSTAPEYTPFNDDAGHPNAFRDSPEWGSAVILSPWSAFQAYGDLAPLRAHYTSMLRYAAYLHTRAKDGILSYGLGDWYDIGPGEPGPSKLTEVGLTPTAIYYQDLTTLAHIATLLGHPEDASRYTAEAAEVKAAFNARFFHPDANQYSRDSQTANAMPLAIGLVPEEHRAAVLANLVQSIEGNGYRVTAGDIGFHYVVRALTDNDRSDVLYRMISLTSNPSYGYQLAQGATTLTEAWDANPKSSQNHFMLGHAEEWFYRGLAGIDLDMSRAPGDQLRLHPFIPAAALDPAATASATLNTPLGKVAVHWSRTSKGLTLDVNVPTQVSLTLPPEFHTAPQTLKAGAFHFQSPAH